CARENFATRAMDYW
nr:immunoglobulin heavy chain junction region [Mus musculus]